ncbi:hypothetical protein LJC05_00670 [Bacteroides sp. OttesenSCG-928-J23]|nr:hypothetical protein [Bacteroides sp. OttesenSCG-928-J23]MDL2305837.1 hypothetical protein [Bacteroides sp. OttesenSCG-928-D19]
MKKFFLFSVLIFLSFSLSAQTGLETGIVIGGGKGNISTDLHPGFSEFTQLDMTNKVHFVLGYRFRLKPVTSSFFFDLDLNAGIKLWGYEPYAKSVDSSGGRAHSPGPDCTYIYGSFAATANYLVYNGLSVGVGVEPRYYFYQSGSEMNTPAIDVPVLTKLSYNFRFIELGFTYKLGIFNTLKNSYINSLRFNDWQLSVFIPF